MNFGVPSQRVKKEEKYPNKAILTLAAVSGKGGSRGILLNGKAVEALGIQADVSTVSFSFDGGIFIANGNQSGIPDAYKLKVTKNVPRKVSDKKTYEYIVKSMGLDDSMDNEFQLMMETIGTLNVARIVPMDVVSDVAVDEVETVNEPVVAETMEDFVQADNVFTGGPIASDGVSGGFVHTTSSNDVEGKTQSATSSFE